MLLKKTGQDFSFEITVRHLRLGCRNRVNFWGKCTRSCPLFSKIFFYLIFNVKIFQVIDDKNIQRQICVSTWQVAKNKKCLCVVQLRLSTSWDYFNINLARVTNALFETRYVETVKIKVSVSWGPGQNRRTFTQIHSTSHFCFYLQINANCRIRSVYLSDRVYSNDELPNDYKVNFSGAKQAEPSRAGAMANSSLLVPAGSGRQRQRGLHHPRTGTGLQPTAAGEEYICGFYTILNSTDKKPLKFWAREVSVYKTMNTL